VLTLRDVAVLPSREAIEPMRAELARTRTLLEIRAGGAGPEWTVASADVPFAWERGRPLAGAKRFFFAPRETLLTWAGETVSPAEPEARPLALIGVHACDLAAIAHQDRFFADDPWYQRRRGQAFLLGIDCLAACAGGFCRDVDAGPFARGGFDLDLTPLLDGRVVAVPGTPAGLNLLGVLGLVVEPPSPALAAAYEEARERAEASFPARPALARAMARIDAGEVTHGEWHALGPSCISCTGCTNVCPTCSCFTVVDEPGGGGGVRVRVWDSCLLEGFQREASGHTPAPHTGDRVRRFWTHKLESAYVPACGRLGCVGCGRCDVTCPGGIGALGVLGRLGGG
jgi:formate hydrogenlyase subunit 6/NADH:ubiquinone oxidoreductase subunit I